MLPSNLSEFEVSNPPKKPSNRIGGLVVMISLLIVLVGVIVVAVTRLPTGVLSPRPSAAIVPGQPATAVPGTPADAATQQAIKTVVQQVDDAQVQAIATNDPNPMAPMATADFYQQEVASNQDLVNNGVTQVKIVSIEWGDITVNGSTATATNYETWSTTFDDGTTEQSRDRNVYTLVQVNGTWKVQSDDHPDQAAAGAPPAPAPAP